MAKIIAPNKEYTGISASVQFINGVGECTNPYLLNWFKSKGYIVEEVKDDKKFEVIQEPEGTQETEDTTKRKRKKS